VLTVIGTSENVHAFEELLSWKNAVVDDFTSSTTAFLLVILFIPS
jgi:hypothetical protein